jgi:transcriptional regulator with XRE-family HTH domain
MMVLSVHHPRYVALREHLKNLRRQAGLTQIEIATRLKLDQSYVSKIERGERYVDVLFYVDWCRACSIKTNKAIALLEKAALASEARQPASVGKGVKKTHSVI